MKFKTNDIVKVISGNDKGKKGKIIQVFLKEERIVVEGVNLRKKNVRPKQEGQKGQVVEYNAPFNASNAMLVCSKCGKTTRIKMSVPDKKSHIGKERQCKKCDKVI